VANSAAFGSAAGGTTVSSGAELLVDASGLNIPEPLTIGGSGLGPAGALTVGDTMNSIWSGKVTASADTVFAAGFSSIFTFADSLLAGGNAVTFASKTSSYFVLASNVTASAVSLGALPGDVATGGLHLNGPNETLTNIQVLLNIQASSTPPANSGLFAKHSLALGTNSTVVLTNGQSIGNTGARLSLENNVSIPSGVGLLAYCPGQGLDGPGGYRCTLSVRSNSTNIWNGPITIHGADPALSSGGLFTLYAGENAVGGRMVVNGNLTIADGVANVLIRGFSGSGSIQGIVNLGTNNLQMADASPWTISSTGNTWAEAQLGGSGASLNLGQHNALCLTAPVRLANGAPANALDLQGYNQQLAGLYSISGTGSTVRNSSTNTDSTLKVLSNVGSNWVYSGTIANVGGAKALHLDVAGDTLTLENAGNNYAGNTTIRSGATLALSGNGNITASPLVDIQGGGTLDVTALTAGSWTMGAALTLKGNGTVVGVLNVSGTVAPGGSIGQLNVTGDVTMNNGGTSLMEVNNAAGTNDVLDVSGTLTYGGTLVVTNISGTPYSNGQVIKLFNAGSYVGSFANIVIAGGGSYDASNLAVNGTITVYSVSTTPTSLTFFTTGGGTAMDLSWPADHTGWRLQAQTNSLSTGLTTTWHTVPGSTTTNHMIIPVAPGNPTVFFRLIYP
jgi:hypothetical protein